LVQDIRVKESKRQSTLTRELEEGGKESNSGTDDISERKIVRKTSRTRSEFERVGERGGISPEEERKGKSLWFTPQIAGIREYGREEEEPTNSASWRGKERSAPPIRGPPKRIKRTDIKLGGKEGVISRDFLFLIGEGQVVFH